MKMLVVLAVTVLLVVQHGEAGQNFPPEAQYLTMQTFRKINPDIEEDWTDYMQELAGEFTTCEQIFIHQGHWEVQGKKAPNGDKIGGLMDYVARETVERQGIDAIAKEVFEKWIGTFPFNEQIRYADHFGCSVAPGCPPNNGRGVIAPTGYAVVGCGFFPTCKNEGCVADAPIPTPAPFIEVKARALTPEQYVIAEEIMEKRWDRTHLLEDLSGLETDCNMYGSSVWAFSKAIEQARLRGLDIYGRFGYTLHPGNTPDPMKKILRDIRDEEQENVVGRQAPGNQFGCSIIPDCLDRGGRGDMFVVVSCLFSRTEIRQDFRGRGQPFRSRAISNQPSRDFANNRNDDQRRRSAFGNNPGRVDPQYLPVQPIRASENKSPVNPVYLPNSEDRRIVKPLPNNPNNPSEPVREIVKPLPRNPNEPVRPQPQYLPNYPNEERHDEPQDGNNQRTNPLRGDQGQLFW